VKKKGRERLEEKYMYQAKVKESKRAFERTDKKLRKQKYVLRLYVTGVTPRSTRAIENIKKICEEHLKDRYDLHVIDIYQQAVLAKGEQIIAAPTLVKKLPLPLRRFIGDMSNKEKILMGLDLKTKVK
jgi:circadian clock protein KaiB